MHAIAHAIVATVIEHRGGHPIEQTWQPDERVGNNLVAAAACQLLAPSDLSTRRI